MLLHPARCDLLAMVLRAVRRRRVNLIENNIAILMAETESVLTFDYRLQSED
jgi:hypothetical protein